MDYPRFFDDEDITLIDGDDHYKNDSQYDTTDKSRTEETLFPQNNEQKPAVKLRQKILHDHITELYRYLDVDLGNGNLVNTNLFKVEKSKSGVVELHFFNGETWVSLTNK